MPDFSDNTVHVPLSLDFLRFVYQAGIPAAAQERAQLMRLKTLAATCLLSTAIVAPGLLLAPSAYAADAAITSFEQETPGTPRGAPGTPPRSTR
jgi:hypothetical protein